MKSAPKNFETIGKLTAMAMLSLTLVFGITGSARAAGLVVCGGGAGELSAAQTFANSPTQTNQTNFQTNSCQLSDIFREAAFIANGLIALAAGVALVLIVVAGFRLILASGNEGATKDAREHVTNAIIGLVIVLAAFLVINTIFSVLAVSIGGTTSFPYNPFTS